MRWGSRDPAAIVLAGLSALANFFFIPYYPFWAILVIALDVWVIWSLTRPGVLDTLAFFITFFTLIDGPTEDSVFGYGFFPGFLALAIWSIATSIATYRAVATTAGELVATEADS